MKIELKVAALSVFLASAAVLAQDPVPVQKQEPKVRLVTIPGIVDTAYSPRLASGVNQVIKNQSSQDGRTNRLISDMEQLLADYSRKYMIEITSTSSFSKLKKPSDLSKGDQSILQLYLNYSNGICTQVSKSLPAVLRKADGKVKLESPIKDNKDQVISYDTIAEQLKATPSIDLEYVFQKALVESETAKANSVAEPVSAQEIEERIQSLQHSLSAQLEPAAQYSTSCGTAFQGFSKESGLQELDAAYESERNAEASVEVYAAMSQKRKELGKVRDFIKNETAYCADIAAGISTQLSDALVASDERLEQLSQRVTEIRDQNASLQADLKSRNKKTAAEARNQVQKNNAEWRKIAPEQTSLRDRKTALTEMAQLIKVDGGTAEEQEKQFNASEVEVSNPNKASRKRFVDKKPALSVPAVSAKWTSQVRSCVDSLQAILTSLIELNGQLLENPEPNTKIILVGSGSAK